MLAGRPAVSFCREGVMGVGEDFATFRDNYQIPQEKISNGLLE
jgi:hypothetical protein